MAYRSDERFQAPVTYTHVEKKGCAIPIMVGLALGGGFAALGWALGWMATDYTGLVIGGACALAFVVTLALLIRLGGTGKTMPGSIVLQGSVVSFPEVDLSVDLTQPHVGEVTADEQSTLVRLVHAEYERPLPAVDEVSRQLHKLVRPGLRLSLGNVAASRAEQVFELPAFVGPHPQYSGGTELDANDPRHQPLITALLRALALHRQHNTRYQVFAALPWDQPAAPGSPLLQQIKLPPETDPAAYFDDLLQQPEGNDPSNALGVVARAYTDVRIWVDEQIGVSPDYLLIDSFAREGQRFNDSDVHCFALVPIGAGRSSARRETRTVPTGTNLQGSTSYPSVVVEAPTLPEPLEVVFTLEVVQEADHQLDALVAFANRA